MANITGSFMDDSNPMSGNVESVPHIGIQGPRGPQGPKGGHYIPTVKQTSEKELQFEFSPSSPDMPYVEPVTATLPETLGSGGNVDLTGVVKSVNGQTPDENGNVTIAVSGGGAVVADYDVAVKSINHRGYNTVAPENTIPAFILSAQNGFEFVECDVSFTSDGVCVLLHDNTIDRTSNGTGDISSMTYAEALQYDYGSWKSADYAGTHIPTLKEFLTVCKALKLHPYIEIKSDSGTHRAMIESIVSTVKATGMRGKVSYISFNATYLGYVKAVDPFARLGYVVRTVDSGILATANGLKTNVNEVFIDCQYDAITDEIVALCINADIPLEVWTANSQDWIESMNPYISGVTADKLRADKILYEKYSVYTAPDVAEKTLTSISATYSGGDVTVGTHVTALTGVVVTAHYSDGSTEIVNGYALSGTIEEGSNTVTVTYQGKTTTFTVNGVSESGGENYTPVSASWVSGFVDPAGKINTSSTKGEMCTDYIPVIPGETYKFRNSNSSWTTNWIGIGFYDKNQTFIERAEYEEDTSDHTFTVPNNAGFMRVSSRNMADFNATAVIELEETSYCNVTNNLNHVTSNNTANKIAFGATYTATLTLEIMHDIYSVAVTMGGVDITASAYADGVVNIATVSGDVAIVATGAEKQTTTVNVGTWSAGFIATNGTFKSSTAGEMCTDFIAVTSGETYKLYNTNSDWTTDWIGVGFYKEDQTFSSRKVNQTSVNSYVFTVPDNVNFMRVSSRNLADHTATAVIVKYI